MCRITTHYINCTDALKVFNLADFKIIPHPKKGYNISTHIFVYPTQIPLGRILFAVNPKR